MYDIFVDFFGILPQQYTWIYAVFIIIFIFLLLGLVIKYLGGDMFD